MIGFRTPANFDPNDEALERQWWVLAREEWVPYFAQLGRDIAIVLFVLVWFWRGHTVEERT